MKTKINLYDLAAIMLLACASFALAVSFQTIYNILMPMAIDPSVRSSLPAIQSAFFIDQMNIGFIAGFSGIAFAASLLSFSPKTSKTLRLVGIIAAGIAASIAIPYYQVIVAQMANRHTIGTPFEFNLTMFFYILFFIVAGINLIFRKPLIALFNRQIMKVFAGILHINGIAIAITTIIYGYGALLWVPHAPAPLQSAITTLGWLITTGAVFGAMYLVIIGTLLWRLIQGKPTIHAKAP